MCLPCGLHFMKGKRMVYERGKNRWWMDVTIDGLRYRRTTKQKTEKLAESFERQFISTVLQNNGLLPRRSPRLVDFISDFTKWSEQRKDSGAIKPKTHRYYENGCEILKATALAGMKLDAITDDDVQATPLPGSAPYKNQAIRTLRRLLGYAVTRKLVKVAPRLSLYDEEGREAVLDAEQEQAILANGSQLLRDALVFIQDAGLRPDEVSRVRIENIDWKTCTYFNASGKTKKARRRIPMSKRLFDALFVRAGKRKEGWLFTSKRSKTGHVTADSLSRAFCRAKRAAKLPEELVLYSARHTYGTAVYSATGNLKVVMEVMGHSDVKTAMRYQHPELDQVRTAIDNRNTASGIATEGSIQ